MKLGAYLGYWGVGMGSDDLIRSVQEAERSGYDSVWAAEAYGSDAATILAVLAGGTSKIKPGSAIFQMPARSSREQNFYNRLVQRYGFEAEAAEIQDLYLAGKKDEAAASIPTGLIDMVSLAGPRDAVRDRLAAFRDAGVGTLLVAPIAFTTEDRVAQLRGVAELAED